METRVEEVIDNRVSWILFSKATIDVDREEDRIDLQGKGGTSMEQWKCTSLEGSVDLVVIGNATITPLVLGITEDSVGVGHEIGQGSSHFLGMRGGGVELW